MSTKLILKFKSKLSSSRIWYNKLNLYIIKFWVLTKKIINKPKTETKRSKGELKNVQNSIISKIYKQIKENYTLPPAPDLKVLDDITVQLRIYVGPDGTINKTVVKKKSLIKAKDDPTYLPYVEAAQRAIKRLGKFSKLPEEEYNLWKIIDISFTPYQT